MYSNKLFKFMVCLSIVLSSVYMPLGQSKAEELEGILTNTERSSLINQGFTDEEIEEVTLQKKYLGADLETITDLYPHTAKNISADVTSDIQVSNSMPTMEWTHSRINATSEKDIKTLKHIKTGENQAPFSIGTEYENISVLDGSLSISEEDLQLVGRNGLSFELKRTYNSSNAQYYDMNVDEQIGIFNTFKVAFDTNIQEEKMGYYASVPARTDYEYTNSCTSTVPVSTKIGVRSTTWPSSTTYSYSYSQARATAKAWEVLGTRLRTGAWSACSNNKKQREVTFTSGPSDVYEDYNKTSKTSVPGTQAFIEEFYTESEAKEFADIISSSIGEIYDYTDWDYRDGNKRMLYVIGNSVSPDIDPISNNSYSYKNKSTKSFVEKKFPLGKGWSWDIPYLQIENNRMVLYFPDKGSFEVVNNQLKGYTWKDLTFTTDTSQTVNLLKSQYSLKTTEGTNYFFDQSGKLIKITDPYNNYIIFKYSNHSIYGDVLTEIQNSLNNKIVISYVENEVRILQEDKIVKYVKEKSKDDLVELLAYVFDPKGRKTTYDYDLREAKYNLMGLTPIELNPYALLVGVTHPTGVKTKIGYETAPFSQLLNDNAVNQTYRVLNRKEETTYNNDDIIQNNTKTFTYDQAMSGSYSSTYSYITKVVEMDKITSYYINRKYNATKGSADYYKEKEITEGTADSKQILEYYYDQNGYNPNPIKTTKTFENKTTFQKSIPVVTEVKYNDYGRVLSETNELGFRTIYEYDPSSQLLIGLTVPSTSMKAKYTEFDRNTKGSIIKETVKENNKDGKVLYETLYEDFDEYGNSRKESTQFGDKKYLRTFEFGEEYGHAFLTKETRYVTESNNQQKQITVSATYYPDTGNLASISDGEGYITGYSYDKLDRLTTITNPDNSTINYKYDDLNNRIETKDEIGNITFEEWNPIGWKIKEGIGDEDDVRTVMHYSETGDLISSSNALGQITLYEYDFLNRITKETNPLGYSKTTRYDDVLNNQTLTDEVGNRVQKLLDAAGRTIRNTEFFAEYNRSEEFTYNNAGQALTENDAKGQLTAYNYDVLGNLVSVSMPNHEITHYEYDYLGNVTKVTYPDNTFSSKQFDEGGRMLSKTDINQKSSTYQYDDNDQLIQSTDRNGNQQKYYYNNRNWQTKIDTLKESIIVDTVKYDYYLNGTRKFMEDATGITQYAYDSEGHLLNMVYPDGKSISYQYDKQGNKKEIISPFNTKIVYQFNELNQINQLGVDDDDNLVTYDYLANGQLKNKTQANGLTSSYIFDHSNLTELKHFSQDKVLNNGIYEYDLNKNIEKVTEPEEISNFTYDAMNRVKSNSQGTESYAYDKKGNRSLLGTDKLPSIENRTYEYDANNQLIKVTTAGNQIEYRYNGDGLLYEKESGNQITRYYYDGEVLLAEADVQDGQAVMKNHYVTGNEKELLINANQQLYYYVTDGLENIIELRDETGNPVNKYRYDMWGNSIVTEEEMDNTLRYSGEVWEESIGLQYLRSRWYDPSLGRFLNEDSFEGRFENPLSLNQYTYVEQNPLIYNDSKGTYKSKKTTLENTAGGLGSFSKGTTIGNVGPAKSSVSTGINNKITNLVNGIKSWLGSGTRLIKNKSGDIVLLSKNGKKRVRFDIKNPSPHQSPHGHVEELINGKWKKSGQLYPKDVPHK